MARSSSFRKEGKVSVWLCLCKPDLTAMENIDILRDLCGVDYYDLDNQELSARNDSFPEVTVAKLLTDFSYSSSFIEPALQIAKEKKLTKAYWALAQFDFAYNPQRAKPPVAKDPLFLGVFDWNDSEDDEE